MMMTFLLLLTILSISSAIPSKVQTHPGCAHGGSFWCQDLTTALQCNKLSYCDKYVWRESALDTTNKGIRCEICVKIMKKVKKRVSGNSINAVMKKLRNICDKLGVFSNKCHSIIDKHIKSIAEAIKKNEDARLICVDIGICKDKTHPH